MRYTAHAIAAAAILVLGSTPAAGDSSEPAKSKSGGSTIGLRKRLHIDPLITPPGTVELDFASLYSFSSANYQVPAVIKYTPVGSHVIWGRTEYSLAFDSLDSTAEGGARLMQFSQSVTLAATSVVHDGKRLDFAIAPQATIFLRDEAGARLGTVVIARYDGGHNSIGGTVSWTGATHSSPTNPAGTFDLGLGYGRNLSGSDFAEKFTPHCNVVWEKPTGHPPALSVFEGVEYQMTPRFAFDLSAQHFTVTGGVTDHQVLFGIAVTFGKLQ